MTESEYRKDATAKGFAEPVEKSWAAHHVNASHTHEHALYLRITKGRMILGIETATGLVTTTLEPAGMIDVPAGCQHSEEAGPDGVTFLVASR